MKRTGIFMGVVAVGAFLAAFLFTAQVRGNARSLDQPGAQTEIEICLPAGSEYQTEPQTDAMAPSSWMQSSVQAEEEPSVPTEPPGDEQAEGGLCTPPSTGSPAGIASTIEGEPVLKLLPHDAIASVDEPKMVPAAAAAGFMRDDELVIGVSDGQEARAYSTWHLDRHEIVNDRLGETPIAATW